MNNKNIKIVSEPYVFENAFTNENGQVVEYAQLRVDVQIGDTKRSLTYKLKGFEAEYIKSLISADNAFGSGDINAN